MAKIKLSSIGITNLSGKAGGTIYSRNRGGNYAKNFAVPTNPDTLAQQTVRGIFGGISSEWRQLTQSERESWNAQAQNYPQKDVFGDTFYLSGFGLYQKLNGNLRLNGQNGINSALPPQGVPSITNATLTAEINAGTQTLSLDTSYSTTSIPAAELGIIYQGAPQKNKGSSYSKSDYRSLTVPSTAMTSPITQSLITPYRNVFGQLVGDMQISMRVALINLNTGEVSAWFVAQAVVTVNP